MQPDSVVRFVSASVTPVVVISAAALMCLAFYNRLAAIVLRLRAVQRERLELQDRLDRKTPGDGDANGALRTTCVLESLSEQTVRICRRAHLIRATLLCLLLTIGSLVVSSLLNGLTVLWPNAIYGGVGLFVAGMLCLLSGVTCALLELRAALDPAELETDVVSELTGFGTP